MQKQRDIEAEMSRIERGESPVYYHPSSQAFVVARIEETDDGEQVVLYDAFTGDEEASEFAKTFPHSLRSQAYVPVSDAAAADPLSYFDGIQSNFLSALRSEEEFSFCGPTDFLFVTRAVKMTIEGRPAYFDLTAVGETRGDKDDESSHTFEQTVVSVTGENGRGEQKTVSGPVVERTGAGLVQFDVDGERWGLQTANMVCYPIDGDEMLAVDEYTMENTGEEAGR